MTRRLPGRPLRALAPPLMLLLALLGVGPANGAAVDYATRTVTLALRQEPPQLDSTKATDQVSGQVLAHVMEGLTGYDLAGRLRPGVAERWEIRADGATFWLRDDARWSDGAPVTAHDFVFAWRRVVDPANASEYAFITYGIEHAEAIVEGRRPPADLGVRAVGDHRLEVTFERPIAYFDKLVAFGTFNPVREDFYRATNGRFGADADELVYNGPFMITEWAHGARLRMKKNPHYWNAEDIWLDAIHYDYITSDGRAVLNLFKDDRIAMADLDSETMLEALEERRRILRHDDGSVWYLDYNFREGRPTTNWHLRHALALAFDPYELINRVIAIPGYRPGSTIFPIWLRGPDDLLRREIPPPEPVTDFAEARRHVEIAREELGGTIPPLVLLTDDTPTATRQAEYFQTLWGENLGLEIRIDKQIFKQRLAKMTAGDFDLVTAGWGPDYNDPLTFGDLYASWNLNNRGRYADEQVDACVRRAQNSVDPQERLAAFDCIQRRLLETHAFLPTYERARVYVVDPDLRDFVRRQVGADVDVARARIAPPAGADAASTAQADLD